MKNIILILAILGFNINPSFAGKNNTVTQTIEVSGNCNMCKKTIENAAYLNGVKRAEWNKENHKLEVTYNSSKTSLDEIAQNIANAGYDANGIIADEEAYKQLPNCCHYKSGEACAH